MMDSKRLQNQVLDGTSEAEEYLELIRRDSFLGNMLSSYERSSQYSRDLEALDYGCGYGWGSYVLAGVCRRVTGYDPDGNRISFAGSIFRKENIRFCLEEHEITEQSYDVACLFMVLPYVREADKLLERLGGYIKKGGSLFLSYKHDNGRLSEILEQWGSSRGFRLLSKREFLLSEAENMVECSYCKDR